MRCVRAVLFGMVTAVIAAVCWVVTTFVIPIALPFLVSRFTGEGGAGGGYVTSDSIAIVALLGFISGVGWSLSRWR
jgi:hypothetical protein